MTAATHVGAPNVQQIPLAALVESPWNRRKHFEPKALAELAASLKAGGQITPIGVRPHPTRLGLFEIFAGHRRLRAAKAAGLGGRSEERKVLSPYDYEPVGAKPCKHAVAGLVVSGENLGSVRQICAERSCKTHHGASYSYDSPAARAREAAGRRRREQEQRLKTDIRKEALFDVVARVPARPGVEELRLVAAALVDEMHHDALKRYCELVALKPTRNRSYGGIDYDAPILARIRAAKMPELVRVLVGLALVPDTVVSPYDSSGPDRIQAAAKTYGVKLAAVERRVRAAAKAAGDKKVTFAGFLSVACPHCQAKAGSPCKRPSGHGTFGGEPHASRVKAAAAASKKATK